MKWITTVLIGICYTAIGMVLEHGFNIESPPAFAFYGFCCALFYIGLQNRGVVA